MSTAHVRVRVGGEDYAIGVDHVREIAELGELAPIPGASAEILGVQNLRGQLIAVIDVAALFGLATEGPVSRIVVAEHRDCVAGLAIESVLDVTDMSPSHEDTDERYLRSRALIDGTLVGVIDIAAVLDGVRAGAVA